MLHLDASAVVEHLPVQLAIRVLDDALRSGAELPHSEPRSRISAEGGELLVMPAVGDAGAGIKLVSVATDNPGKGLPLIHGVYALFAPGTLRLEALIDGPALTGVRTAAVSGWVTDLLASPEAARLVMFGSGPQAHAHLDAMLAVREITDVRVVSRNKARAEQFAERARERGIEAGVGDAKAVADADLVCCCTSSPRPVFDGALLMPGTHVNAIGAHTPETRELDATALLAGRVVVETRAAALSEAGDLLLAIEGGDFTPSDIVADLSELARGAPVRRTADDITVFKSVGVAFEDLLLARAVVDRANAAQRS